MFFETVVSVYNVFWYKCFQRDQEHLWNKSILYGWGEKRTPFCCSALTASIQQVASVMCKWKTGRKKDIFLLFGSILCFSTVGFHFVFLCFILKHLKCKTLKNLNKWTSKKRTSPLKKNLRHLTCNHCSDSYWNAKYHNCIW